MAMTPVMTGMVCAFLMLDERDEGIGTYYRVTPAGGRAYLAARLGFPMLWAFISSLLVIGLFALAVKNVAVIITAAVLGTFQGIITCMLLVVLAGNKVEGLALAKLTNFFVLGLPAAWFINAPYKYLLGFLPSFWLGEIMRASIANGALPVLLCGLAGILSSVVGLPF
jgi:fluoroquinolone transport system permease protein